MKWLGLLVLVACQRESRALERTEYVETAYDVSEGRTLYRAFNCVGCHANGGGGMGPALMDSEWAYGSSPDDIEQSIVEGRPRGMPAYRDRITPRQLQQIVAYVRSLGGFVRGDMLSPRSDHAQTTPPPNLEGGWPVRGDD
jgi:cytochrome c oxidase cbb3-type subunit 3